MTNESKGIDGCRSIREMLRLGLDENADDESSESSPVSSDISAPREAERNRGLKRRSPSRGRH